MYIEFIHTLDNICTLISTSFFNSRIELKEWSYYNKDQQMIEHEVINNKIQSPKLQTHAKVLIRFTR